MSVSRSGTLPTVLDLEQPPSPRIRNVDWPTTEDGPNASAPPLRRAGFSLSAAMTPGSAAAAATSVAMARPPARSPPSATVGLRPAGLGDEDFQGLARQAPAAPADAPHSARPCWPVVLAGLHRHRLFARIIPNWRYMLVAPHRRPGRRRPAASHVRENSMSGGSYGGPLGLAHQGLGLVAGSRAAACSRPSTTSCGVP